MRTSVTTTIRNDFGFVSSQVRGVVATDRAWYAACAHLAAHAGKSKHPAPYALKRSGLLGTAIPGACRLERQSSEMSGLNSRRQPGRLTPPASVQSR
jgi:hypothetical protein